MAQSVEHILGKDEVTSSILVSSSTHDVKLLQDSKTMYMVVDIAYLLNVEKVTVFVKTSTANE